MCPFTINTTMQFTSLMSHFLSLVVSKMCFVSCNACARGDHLHAYTFLVPKSTIFHADVFFLQEIERTVFAFLDPNNIGQTGNVLGSWCVVWYFSSVKTADFPMSLVCCPLTRPGVTFAVVRSLHWDDGDDDTHCSLNSAISWKVAFDFFRRLAIVGRLTWNIGYKPEDGMVTHCVVHYDTCPGVCLNLTDGSS